MFRLKSPPSSLNSNNSPLPSLTLRSNFKWSFVGNAIYAACQWLMVVSLAKIGTPTMVGQFSLSFALTAPAFLLTNLKLRSIQVTDGDKRYQFGDYLNLRFSLTSLALLYALLISCLAGYRLETVIIIIGVGIAKFFEAISDIFYGLMQQKQRMDFIASSMISKGVLSLLTLGLVVFFTKSLVAGVYCMAVVWAILLVFYDMRRAYSLLGFLSSDKTNSFNASFGLPQFSLFTKRWEWKKLIDLCKVAFPLGVQSMLGSLLINIPIYFLSNYYGEKAVGHYSSMAYFMVIGNTVTLAAGQAALPRICHYYEAGRKNRLAIFRLINALTLISLALGCFGVILALFAGKEILTIVYSKDYATQVPVLVWLMVAASFSYLYCPFWYSTTALQLFTQQSWFFSLSVLATFVSSWLLIPTYGLVGAAWAATSGNAILFLSCAALHYKHVNKLIEGNAE